MDTIAPASADHRSRRQLSYRDRWDFNKLQQRLRRNVGRAIEDFNMIEAGDRVMVCVSGGKDSHTLLDILVRLQRKAPVDFTLAAVTLDQKQPGYPADLLPEYFRSIGVEYHVIEQDTYSTVRRVIAPGKTTCGLCSRLRRGILYGYAERQGFTRIALGHHRDDIVETLFLNMFHGATLKAMPPKLRSDDGRHVVIRPLAYCRESDIVAYARQCGFPLVPCDLCGSQTHLQRQAVKQMLRDWERAVPGRIENIFRSLQRVVPSHLADGALFDFTALGSRSGATATWLPERAEHELSADPTGTDSAARVFWS